MGSLSAAGSPEQGGSHAAHRRVEPSIHRRVEATHSVAAACTAACHANMLLRALTELQQCNVLVSTHLGVVGFWPDGGFRVTGSLRCRGH